MARDMLSDFALYLEWNSDGQCCYITVVDTASEVSKDGQANFDVEKNPSSYDEMRRLIHV